MRREPHRAEAPRIAMYGTIKGNSVWGVCMGVSVV